MTASVWEGTQPLHPTSATRAAKALQKAEEGSSPPEGQACLTALRTTPEEHGDGSRTTGATATLSEVLSFCVTSQILYPENTQRFIGNTQYSLNGGVKSSCRSQGCMQLVRTEAFPLRKRETNFPIGELASRVTEIGRDIKNN